MARRGEVRKGNGGHKHANNLPRVMQDISEKTAWTNTWDWSMRSSR